MRVWEGRCYADGIPDVVPDGVMKSSRVPSYKAIAIAILKNDHNMYSLGFSERSSVVVDRIIDMNREPEKSKNMDLFGPKPAPER